MRWLLLGWWFAILWQYDGENRYVRFGAFETEAHCSHIRELVLDSRHPSMTSACSMSKPTVLITEQGEPA